MNPTAADIQLTQQAHKAILTSQRNAQTKSFEAVLRAIKRTSTTFSPQGGHRGHATKRKRHYHADKAAKDSAYCDWREAQQHRRGGAKTPGDGSHGTMTPSITTQPTVATSVQANAPAAPVASAAPIIPPIEAKHWPADFTTKSGIHVSIKQLFTVELHPKATKAAANKVQQPPVPTYTPKPGPEAAANDTKATDHQESARNPTQQGVYETHLPLKIYKDSKMTFANKTH